MSHIKGYINRIFNLSNNAKNFLICIILNFVNLGAIQVILGLYILQLGYTEKFFGLAVAARILATGLMAIPAGILYNKIGARKLLISASLLASLTVIIQGLTSEKFLILGANFVYGSAFAVLFVLIGPFLSRNSKQQEREELFSFNFVLMSVARMFGSFLVGLLPGIYIYIIAALKSTNLLVYRYVLFTLGIISLLAIIPVLFITNNKEVNKNQKPKKDPNFINGLKTAKIGKLGLYKFLLGIGGGLIAPYFSIFLAQKLGATTSQIGIIMFVYRVTIAIALFLTPYLIKKAGKVKSVGIAQVSSLPFLLVIVLVPNFAVATMAFLIRGALMGMTRPIASDFAMEITNDSQQTATSSFMRATKSVARSGSATMAGWVISNYGFTATYILTFIFYLAGAFLFVKSFLKLEQ